MSERKRNRLRVTAAEIGLVPLETEEAWRAVGLEPVKRPVVEWMLGEAERLLSRALYAADVARGLRRDDIWGDVQPYDYFKWIIEFGRHLERARNALRIAESTKHGEDWTDFCHALRISYNQFGSVNRPRSLKAAALKSRSTGEFEDTISKYVTIANDSNIANPDNWPYLPIDYTTLYECSFAPPEKFKELITKGVIHSKVTTRAVQDAISKSGSRTASKQRA
jgi:hypothetical protein